MRKAFEWYAVIVLVVIAVVAFVTFIVSICFNSGNGIIDSGFHDIVDKFEEKVEMPEKPEGPTLKVFNPNSKDADEPSYSTEASYTVNGTVESESGVKSVTVNGENAAVNADGTWSAEIILTKDVTTTVTVVATNNENGSTSETRYVHYADVTAYALVLDNSANSSTNTTPMIFVQETEAPTVGSTYVSETYGELPVTAVYTGFETDAKYTTTSDTRWYRSSAVISSVIVEDEITPVATARWFSEFSNCAYMNLEKFNMQNVVYMTMMFYNAGTNVETFRIDGLANWNTSLVENMYGMFQTLGDNVTTNWSIGDISGWDVSSVNQMAYMFSRAGYNATTFVLDLSGWDTSSVLSMFSMFEEAGYNAGTFRLIGLDGWNTSSVSNFAEMFNKTSYEATSWSIGDLSEWDTGSATNMSYMFSSAGRKATTWSIGDISKWNTSLVTNMNYMFSGAGASATYTLDLSGWNVSKVTKKLSFNEYVTDKVISPF